MRIKRQTILYIIVGTIVFGYAMSNLQSDAISNSEEIDMVTNLIYILVSITLGIIASTVTYYLLFIAEIINTDYHTNFKI